jgi:hypothetical protein
MLTAEASSTDFSTVVAEDLAGNNTTNATGGICSPEMAGECFALVLGTW